LRTYIRTLSLSVVVLVAACSSEPAPPGGRGGDSLGVHTDPLSVDPSIPFLDFDQNADNPKSIALTFDDGPDGNYCTQVLDALKAANVKATFFVNTNNYVDVNASSVARNELVRMHSEGHHIGNHTVDHASLALSSTDVVGELDGVYQIMKALVPGALQRRLARAPYGDPYFGPQATLDQVAPIVARYGVHIGWNIDPQDYNCTTDACVLDGVLGAVDAGSNGIVLMHCTQQHTASALPTLLAGLKSRGMQPVFVEDLVSSKYGQPSRDLIICSSDADCVSGETCGTTGHCAPSSTSDAGIDTGPADTGPADTGPADTGPADTGPADTGPADTGPADTGPADTGIDSGKADSGQLADTGVADTNVLDSTVADATILDSGVADSGAFDSTVVDSFVADGSRDATPDTGIDAADGASDAGDAGTDGGTGGTAQFVTCSTTTVQSGKLSGSYVSTACGTSGALAKQDGKNLVWSASSSSTKTVAYATYVLSGTPATMKIDVSFLGDDNTEALWYWTIWNPSTGAWVSVGDNSWAGNWVTTAHQFVLTNPASYVDATGHVKVRFQTKTSTNSAEMDRMVLEVTY
jgi:peptidoglycan/xylan/chitin deacetylase (PgdA/CDA1 family)